MTDEQDTKQIALMQHMVALAEKQTVYSLQRSEMSEFRSYQNAERTLSVWVRTALALMICGLAIDRFGLMLDGNPRAAHVLLLDRLSEWMSIALVFLGVLMVATTGLRFLAYARTWQRQHELPASHGPYLGPFFAMMVALFGAILLVIMMVATS
jgi:uncharacterized membrane protein YidH (DUF202 family)